MDRGTFLGLAGLVEGGLVLAALALAWVLGIDLWVWMRWDGPTLFWSVVATLPLLAWFAVSYRWPVGPLKPIKDALHELLGPSLGACRWYDLPLLAGLAGLGEEWLFRGVIQMTLVDWLGPLAALIVAAVLFGALHAVTPTYAVLATLMGLYFGGLMLLWDPPNLTVPILVHALYDWFGFLVLRADWRRQRVV